MYRSRYASKLWENGKENCMIPKCKYTALVHTIGILEYTESMRCFFNSIHTCLLAISGALCIYAYAKLGYDGLTRLLYKNVNPITLCSTKDILKFYSTGSNLLTFFYLKRLIYYKVEM